MKSLRFKSNQIAVSIQISNKLNRDWNMLMIVTKTSYLYNKNKSWCKQLQQKQKIM